MPAPSTYVVAFGSFAGSAEATTTSCSTLGSWLSNVIVNAVSEGAVSELFWNPFAAAPSGAVTVRTTAGAPGPSMPLEPSSNAAPDANIATPHTPMPTVNSDPVLTRLREATMPTTVTMPAAVTSAV